MSKIWIIIIIIFYNILLRTFFRSRVITMANNVTGWGFRGPKKCWTPPPLFWIFFSYGLDNGTRYTRKYSASNDFIHLQISFNVHHIIMRYTNVLANRIRYMIYDVHILCKEYCQENSNYSEISRSNYLHVLFGLVFKCR